MVVDIVCEGVSVLAWCVVFALVCTGLGVWPWCMLFVVVCAGVSGAASGLVVLVWYGWRCDRLE